MTKREIIRALIKDKQCPERMGIYEHFCWGDTFEKWYLEGYPKGADVVQFFDLDMQMCCGFDSQAIHQDKPQEVSEDKETHVVKNGWGATMRLWKKKSGTPEHIAFDVVNRDVWEKKYREHMLYLDKRRFGNLDDQKKLYAEVKRSGRFQMFSSAFVFEFMRSCLGDVTMLEACALDPDWINDFCTVTTDFMIRHYEFLFSEVGVPDGYFMYEDLGYTRAPFISPAMHRELILPHHKRFLGFIKSYGLPVIMHTCGNITAHIPSIIEAGVDCLQPMEAKTGMNVVELGKTYAGKLAFMGNINIMALETNDRTKVEAEILPKLNGIREHRIPYIFHSDHSISSSVKFGTYQYARELFLKNCRY